MKKISLFLVTLIYSYLSFGQLSIENCQEKAKANYPLIHQYGLIEQTAQYSLSNAAKGYLPQVNISGKATYQSDVTEIPITIPGMNIDSPSKDQYQIAAEINQTIWDGGMISAQKKSIEASTEMERQKTAVDLFAVQERVNQLFFGCLLIKEQLKQNDLLENELGLNFDKVSAYMQNGVANQSDLDVIKVEQLKNKQRRAELLSMQKSYLQMLSAMIGEDITTSSVLIKPEPILPTERSNNRPEIKFFEAQNNLYSSQISSIKSANLPKFSLFAQAGYGRPGLNMLNNDFSTFYIGGLRMVWNLSGFYSQKNNLQKIELKKQSVDVQKETFLYNTNLKMIQQQNDIEKLLTQLKSDHEIIMLRNSIKKSAEAKLENGTLSVSDFIDKLNDENLASQDRSLHEIQLLISIYNLKLTLNN